MKKIGAVLFIGTGLLIAASSCSKCYDCTQQVIIEDSNGNPIDTTTTTDDFCTSKKSEVDDKEKEGFECS